jgi:hypothetical protein
MYRVDLTLPEAEFSAAMTAMRKGLDGHIRWDLDGTAAVRRVTLLGSDGSMLC